MGDRMLKKITYLIMLILISFSVFAASSIRNLPSTVNPGETFTITYSISGVTGSFGTTLEDNVGGGCTPTLIQLGGINQNTLSTTVTAPSSGSCTFSGNIDINSGTTQRITYPMQTVTVQGGTPTTCQATVNSISVSPSQGNVNDYVTISASITHSGLCTFQGGLGVTGRYVDSNGNIKCSDSSCLFSVIDVTQNACESGNPYYATIQNVPSATSMTDTYNFRVKATKLNTYDAIASAHIGCFQAPISKRVVNDAYIVGGCTYTNQCDSGSGSCSRTTENVECGVNKKCKSGVCTDQGGNVCTPGVTSTSGCSNGQYKTCYADGTGWGACQGGSNTCNPACASGQICQSGTCVADTCDSTKFPQKYVMQYIGIDDCSTAMIIGWVILGFIVLLGIKMVSKR